jgi:hypothetical protein
MVAHPMTEALEIQARVLRYGIRVPVDTTGTNNFTTVDDAAFTFVDVDIIAISRWIVGYYRSI